MADQLTDSEAKMLREVREFAVALDAAYYDLFITWDERNAAASQADTPLHVCGKPMRFIATDGPNKVWTCDTPKCRPEEHDGLASAAAVPPSEDAPQQELEIDGDAIVAERGEPSTEWLNRGAEDAPSRRDSTQGALDKEGRVVGCFS